MNEIRLKITSLSLAFSAKLIIKHPHDDYQLVLAHHVFESISLETGLHLKTNYLPPGPPDGKTVLESLAITGTYNVEYCKCITHDQCCSYLF